MSSCVGHFCTGHTVLPRLLHTSALTALLATPARLAAPGVPHRLFPQQGSPSQNICRAHPHQLPGCTRVTLTAGPVLATL